MLFVCQNFSVPVSTNEEREDGTHYRMPLADRIDMLARKARKLASLRYKKPCDKKIAIVFHNYPPTNSNIGSAASLDSIESVRLLLEEMQKQGYRLDNIPTDSQAFVKDITAHATNDRRFISEALLETADGKLEKLDYASFYEQLPKKTQEQLLRDWGEAPGEVCLTGIYSLLYSLRVALVMIQEKFIIRRIAHRHIIILAFIIG